MTVFFIFDVFGHGELQQFAMMSKLTSIIAKNVIYNIFGKTGRTNYFKKIELRIKLSIVF